MSVPNLPSADVAYAGVAGAFAEEAAVRLLGEEASKLPCESFRAVFDAVHAGMARYGVLPVENRTAGQVSEVVRLMAERPVKVVRTIDQPIALALIGGPNAALEGIREAMSHPMALAQCSRFFRENPQIRGLSAYNTAAAVAQVLADNTSHRAAIASERAARLYGGIVVKADIHDAPASSTRFVLVARV